MFVDVLHGSKEVKRLIVKRSQELNITFRELCDGAGIEYQDFMMSYINSTENNKFRISEEKFEKLLSLVGVSIRHQFIIDPNYGRKQETSSITLDTGLDR